ncbi:MAG TPA: 3-oxoacyl-[acyl-carrier-protein] synthase III C-terminal domain-containing protein, partial [Cryobacterium sp.]|nr:3-oxoacyl-[acyl-carrier-protein] synthase III C-terminal domain-containing protein [Cryobacterium sp.]
CSLHLRTSNDPDTIVASSLFADGAAAGIVSGRAPEQGELALSLDLFETVITPIGEGDMAWKIGDEGFEMVLSSYVPHIIDQHIEGALAPLLARDPVLSAAQGLVGDQGLAGDQGGGLGTAVAHWAIHPGGRSILDKTEAKLGLSQAQLAPARETLRRYGNMSSATILFVMKAILEGAAGKDALAPAASDGERVCAMAFGPGLTVETGLMTVIAG